jgi:hypothetical protein
VVVGHVCHFVAIVGYEDAGRLALELAAGDGAEEVMLPQRNEVAVMVQDDECVHHEGGSDVAGRVDTAGRSVAPFGVFSEIDRNRLSVQAVCHGASQPGATGAP